MYQNHQPKIIQRVPKVFQAPHEEDKPVWPRFVKIAIIFMLLAGSIIYLLLFSKVFQVKNIEIVGSPSDAVKEKLESLKGKNIFSFNASQLEEEIISHNQNYFSVKVYRGLPDTVRVKFQDREPRIIWQTQSNKYFVDKEAVLFQETKDSNGLPIVEDTNDLAIEIPTQIATAGFVEFIRLANSSLAEMNIMVLSFEIKETTFQVNAVTDKNFEIIFDTLRPLSEQIDAFRAVYEKNGSEIKEYIDLRVKGWVYYK